MKNKKRSIYTAKAFNIGSEKNVARNGYEDIALQ